MELTQAFVDAGYVATVEQPEFGDSLMHGDGFGLGQAGPLADLVIQLSGPHLDALIKAAATSFADELGKRAADGVVAILVALLLRRPKTRIRVEDEAGTTILDLDRDAVGGDSRDSTAEADDQRSGRRGPRHRQD